MCVLAWDYHIKMSNEKLIRNPNNWKFETISFIFCFAYWQCSMSTESPIFRGQNSLDDKFTKGWG